MNKKLLAVAVAGALALPGVALAQSSVTISGLFKGGFESVKYGNYTRAGNNSITGVADDSSRIIFNVVEDMGGGLQAIGQFDIRPALDTGATTVTSHGNTHVGLRSKQWGRIFMGRQDLHYFNRESDMTAKASLRADSISILAYAGGGGVAIANASRTSNVVHYTTPNWGGFTLIAAYSSSPGGSFAQDGDLGVAARKGRAWHLNPNLAGRNYQVGYSYWNSKNDGGGNTAATGDQRSDRLYGSYTWGGFKVGLAWDKSKIKGATNGVVLSNRTAWSLPVSYTWGAHEIHAHFDKARNDKAAAFAGTDASAKMFAMAYAYNLSKRTSAALAYARINNAVAGTYNFFTNSALGIANLGVAAGEDPRMWAATLRHSF